MTENEVKALIVAGIKEQYGMNVFQFSESAYPKKIGVQGGNTFRCYLSGPASSKPFYTKMCSFLGLGELEKRLIKKEVIVEYILSPVGTADKKVTGEKKKRVLGVKATAEVAEIPPVKSGGPRKKK